jgi:hypothetical protein
MAAATSSVSSYMTSDSKRTSSSSIVSDNTKYKDQKDIPTDVITNCPAADIDRVLQLLEAKASLHDATTTTNDTSLILMNAIDQHDWSLATCLLYWGCSISPSVVCTWCTTSALENAVEKSDQNHVQFLLYLVSWLIGPLFIFPFDSTQLTNDRCL